MNSQKKDSFGSLSLIDIEKPAEDDELKELKEPKELNEFKKSLLVPLADQLPKLDSSE